MADELDLDAGADPAQNDGAEDVDRLLAGRFFTIGNGGTVSAWNPRAQATFGFASASVVGESFVQKLLAPAEREKRTTEIDALLAGDAPAVAVHIEAKAVTADGVEFDERFAIIPIRLHDGYELNNLLQDIGKQREGDADRLRKKHKQVVRVIGDALAGRVDPAGDGADEAQRLVGALVVFDGAGAPASVAVGTGDSAEDDLDAAREQLDQLRSQLTKAEQDAAEARREADTAREEVEKTRGKLSEIRGSADEEQGRAQQLDTELADLRSRLEEADSARKALEQELEKKASELEKAQATGDELTDALRRELEEAKSARDEAAAKLAEKEGELEELAGKRDELANELDQKQTELAEVGARRDELARKLDSTGADLEEVAAKRGELAEELEAKRAELAEVAGRRDELAAELKAKEDELADAAGKRDELVAAVDAKEAEIEAARASESEQTEAVRGELEQVRGELEQVREELEQVKKELTEARTAAEDARAEADRQQARVDELVAALQEAQHGEEAAKKELATANSSAEEARVQAKGALGELDDARHQIELFRGAFDSAPIGMALTAPDGRFVKVNRTLCNELGYSEQQLLSDDPPSIVHPDDVEANREMARRLLAGEIKSSRAERRYVHADGHEVLMRESVSLVRDGDETPLLFIFQLEDATEQIGLGAPDESHELGSASGNLPVRLGGERVADPAAVEGPYLSGERVRQALDEDQFVLYCQPVLDLRSNEVNQYELLIRMIDEDGRLILPQAFLKPAEQSGLIKSIDHWVVRRAVKLIAENHHAGRDVNIEINVSPESLVDRDLIQVIDQELTAHPIDPANLIVEVTESAAAANPEGAATIAKGVRALGARFALDDFGSTFGSFRHLKDLALDFLKIDGDLVSSLSESRTSQLVVKALVDVARGTGTETIAVFVSDDETLMLLRQHGVGYAQGYVVGRPQPLSEVFADGRAALPPAG